jgi:uncharacterized protein YbjQ (UPF0145 family)
MLVTTTETVTGKRIVRNLGLATGTVTRSPGLLRGIVAFIKNLLGGEVDEYTRTIAQAREQALDRMKDHARSLGANAIVSARFASAEVASWAAEIVAYGTAVVIEDDTP